MWQFLRKMGIDLPPNSDIPLLDIYPKNSSSYHKDFCSTLFTVALFIISRNWKQPSCPSTDEWIEKMWWIYPMKYYLAIKNNEVMKVTDKKN